MECENNDVKAHGCRTSSGPTSSASGRSLKAHGCNCPDLLWLLEDLARLLGQGLKTAVRNLDPSRKREHSKYGSDLPLKKAWGPGYMDI